MGHRNPDRVPLFQRRARCETVGQMYADGWKLRARCRTCALEVEVDPRVVAFHLGADYSLWNKLGRCKRVGCHGKAQFLAMAPGMATFEPITSPTAQPEQAPAWLRHRGPG